MKKIWGIIGIVIVIAGITLGRLYIKKTKREARQEQQQISQEDARQFMENQRKEEMQAQLDEQTRKRDSAYQVEAALRQQQIEEMRSLQQSLQKEIDAQEGS